MAETTRNPTRLDRIGGQLTVKNMVEEFHTRLKEHDVVVRLIEGQNAAHWPNYLVELLVELLDGHGSPEQDMTEALRQLDLTEYVFNIVAGEALFVLAEFEIDADIIGFMSGALERLRRSVVTPAPA